MSTIVSKYGKGIGSLVATALVLLIGVVDGGITLAEGLTVGGALLGTIAVVGIPNTVESPALKAVAQALAPVVSGLAVALVTPDGITASVLMQLAVTSLGTVGVYKISNVGDRYATQRAALARAGV